MENNELTPRLHQRMEKSRGIESARDRYEQRIRQRHQRGQEWSEFTVLGCHQEKIGQSGSIDTR